MANKRKLLRSGWVDARQLHGLKKGEAARRFFSSHRLAWTMSWRKLCPGLHEAYDLPEQPAGRDELLWLFTYRMRAIVIHDLRDDSTSCEEQSAGLFKQVVTLFEQEAGSLDKRAPANSPADPSANMIDSAAGQTPLFTAVLHGLPSYVKLLVDAGASPRVPQGQRRKLSLGTRVNMPCGTTCPELHALKHAIFSCQLVYGEEAEVSPLVAAIILGRTNDTLATLLDRQPHVQRDLRSAQEGQQIWLALVGAILHGRVGLLQDLLISNAAAIQSVINQPCRPTARPFVGFKPGGASRGVDGNVLDSFAPLHFALLHREVAVSDALVSLLLDHSADRHMDVSFAQRILDSSWHGERKHLEQKLRRLGITPPSSSLQADTSLPLGVSKVSGQASHSSIPWIAHGPGPSAQPAERPALEPRITTSWQMPSHLGFLALGLALGFLVAWCIGRLRVDRFAASPGIGRRRRRRRAAAACILDEPAAVPVQLEMQERPHSRLLPWTWTWAWTWTWTWAWTWVRSRIQDLPSLQDVWVAWTSCFLPAADPDGVAYRGAYMLHILICVCQAVFWQFMTRVADDESAIRNIAQPYTGCCFLAVIARLIVHESFPAAGAKAPTWALGYGLIALLVVGTLSFWWGQPAFSSDDFFKLVRLVGALLTGDGNTTQVWASFVKSNQAIVDDTTNELRQWIYLLEAVNFGAIGLAVGLDLFLPFHTPVVNTSLCFTFMGVFLANTLRERGPRRLKRGFHALLSPLGCILFIGAGWLAFVIGLRVGAARHRRFLEQQPVGAAVRIEPCQHDLDMQLSLTCSITCERFVDPVLAPDGHTYERAALEQWLKTRKISPLTGNPMPEGELRTNYAIRSLLHLQPEQ